MGIPKKLVNILILVVIAVLLSLAGCRGSNEGPTPAAKAPTKDEDVAAIKRLYEKHDAAVNTRDASGGAAGWTDDAIWMRPDEPAIVGNEAIKSRFQAGFDYVTKEFSTTNVKQITQEVEVVGDWAFSFATWKSTGTTKTGGKPVQNTGKVLCVHKRQPDGSWKTHRASVTRDMPFPDTSK